MNYHILYKEHNITTGISVRNVQDILDALKKAVLEKPAFKLENVIAVYKIDDGGNISQ